MTNLQDKEIKQTSFLNFKGYTCFYFKEDGINYIYDDKQEKIEDFYEYSRLFDYNKPTQVKSSQLYFLLVGILFGLIGVIFKEIFNILFCLTFLFLYYKYYQNFLRISYGFFIKNDSKAKSILEELAIRVKKYRREKQFVIDETNEIEYEKIKFENLLKDQIISENEYNDIMSKLEKTNYKKYQKPVWYDILKKLLNQKGIISNFSVENYTFENEYLPGGIESFSGLIVLSNGDKYNFWLSWDKDSVNQETQEKGYYCLGDSILFKEKYGKSFFYKL